MKQTTSIDALLETIGAEVGQENLLDRSAYALKTAVRRLRPAVVGVHHVTCSDEAERENVETFQRCFVQDLVPRLKYGVQASFRTANLGARFEWHSVRAAENNFSPEVAPGGFKLIVTKISTHCAAHEAHGAVERYGRMMRYGAQSTACLALHAFLDGAREPFCDELDELFHFEGLDRVAALRQIDEQYRGLALAITAARLQARSAVLEAQDHRAHSPTVYVIIPAVTLNKPGRDSEILVGAYAVDRRAPGPGAVRDDAYRGLGDDPSRYVFRESHGKITVSDDQAATKRSARNHRALAVSKLNAMPAHRNPNIDRLLTDARKQVGTDAHSAKKIALMLLPLIAEANPVGAALALFGGGVSGIYDVYRVNKLMRSVEGSRDARAAVGDLESRLASLPPEQVEGVLQVLLHSHK